MTRSPAERPSGAPDAAAAARRTVIAGYSAPESLRAYRSLGLLPAEEILIARYFPRRGRILDLGCGAGRTSIPLWRRGYRVDAVDLTPALIAEARRLATDYRAEIDFRVMDATDLRFADGTFDAALFAFNGLDHVRGRAGKRAALTEVCRVLRPGGPLLFSTHALACRSREARLWRREAVRRGLGRWLGLGRTGRGEREPGELYTDLGPDLSYLHLLPRRAWLALLAEAGFRVEDHARASTVERGRPLGALARWVRDDDYLYYVARRPAETAAVAGQC